MDNSTIFQTTSLVIQGILEDTTLLVATIFALTLLAIILVRLLWRKSKENETLKYEFITIMAHKFRTPLTHIKWAVDELIASEKDSFKKERLLDVQSSNEKLVKLTDALIEMTESEKSSGASYKMERVDFCAFVKSIGDSLKTSFHEKNIFFSVKCPPREIFVRIDKARMEFALHTIFENACLYTPPGKYVEVTVNQTGHKALVSVSDNGIGISPENLPRIFTKFFRAHNAQLSDTEGFGIGLYLSRSIVKRHKGKITAYSAGQDKGSTFTIILKRVK